MRQRKPIIMENKTNTNSENSNKWKKLFIYILILWFITLLFLIYSEFMITENGKTKVELSTNKARNEKLLSEIQIMKSQVESYKLELAETNTSQKERTQGVWYEVQIGAFKDFNLDQYRDSLVNMKIDVNSLKRLTLGSFDKYVQANKFKKDIRRMGIRDAFIIGKIDGERVKIRQAIAAEKEKLNNK
jgi:hypothetical protein